MSKSLVLEPTCSPSPSTKSSRVSPGMVFRSITVVMPLDTDLGICKIMSVPPDMTTHLLPRDTMRPEASSSDLAAT